MSFNYKIENNILYYSGTEFTGSTQLTSLQNAFKNNTTLTKIMPLEGGTVVTGISNWGDAFNGCTVLYSADLSNFDTTAITSDNYVFYNCINLVQLMLPDAKFAANYEYPILSGAAKNQILDVYCNNFQVDYAFDKCLATKIRVHPLTSSDTGYITTLRAMCLNATNLTEIDLSEMTCSVDSIVHHEFAAGCTKLVTIKYPKNLKNFDSNGVDSYQPFKGAGDSSATLTVYGDFSQSTILYGLFNSGSAGCNYKGIDLSNVTPPTKLTNARHLFYGWKNLITVDLQRWSFDSTVDSDATTMFAYCTSLIVVLLPKYNGAVTVGNGLFYNAGSATETLSIYGDMSGITSMSNMFINTKFKKIEFTSIFPPTKLTSIAYVFQNNPNLTEIDMSNFTLSSTSYGSYQCAFKSCPKLEILKLPNTIGYAAIAKNGGESAISGNGSSGMTLTVYGDLSEVTFINGIFSSSNYSNIDLSNVTPSTKLTNISGMFNNNPNLTEIDMSGFTLNGGNYGPEYSSANYAFGNCPNLITLKLPKVVGSIAANTYSSQGVVGGSGKVGMKLTVYGDLSEATDISRLFQSTNYSSINLSNVTPSTKLTNINFAFNNNVNLIRIDMSGFTLNGGNYGPEYSSANYAFGNCPKLITLKLPKVVGSIAADTFSSQGVVGGSGSGGKTLTVYGDLSEATDISRLFQSTNYSNINLSNVTPSTKLTHIYNMFNNNPNITEIDMSNFTLNGGNYGPEYSSANYAFGNCPNLITLKLPKVVGSIAANTFSSQGVVGGSGSSGKTLLVYGDLSEATAISRLFQSSNYSIIDLSSITPPYTKNNVTLESTFANNANLTTIYCENLYTGSTSQNVSNTFSGCSTNLVGGNGTVWNSSNISGSYAVVDSASAAGYFTEPIPEASLTINMDPADSCTVRVIESHKPIKSEFTWRVIITANDGYIYNYSKMADQPKLTFTATSFYINRFEGGDYTLNIKATKITKEYKENPKEYLDTLPSDDVPESTIGDNIKLSDYGLYKLYIPTGWQLIEFVNQLYNTTFIDTLKGLWNNSVLSLSDLIISAQLLPYKPEKSGEQNVKVGFADTSVSMYYYDQQFATINMGSVTVPRAWDNFLDYNPFTTIMIYLPFIGLKELENDDVIGKTLNLKYKIDLLSGDCVAFIMIDNQVKAQFTGNCAYRIPLKENNLSQMALSGIKAAVGVAATVGAGAIMGPAATTLAGLSVAMGSDPVDAAQSIGDIGVAQYVASSELKDFGTSAIQSAQQTYQNPTTRSVDNMGGNQAYCGVDTPYIIVGRSIPDIPNNFAELNGFTSNRQAYLYELKGYTEVYSMLSDSLTATQNEKSEIESLLKKGVIL